MVFNLLIRLSVCWTSTIQVRMRCYYGNNKNVGWEHEERLTTGTYLRMIVFLITRPSSRSASLAMKRSRFPVPSTPTKSRCSPDATQHDTAHTQLVHTVQCYGSFQTQSWGCFANPSTSTVHAVLWVDMIIDKKKNRLLHECRFGSLKQPVKLLLWTTGSKYWI